MLKQTLPIFLVILLGYIGFSLAMPIFPPLLLDPSHGMVSPTLAKKTKTLLLGLLLAMYPIGQLFGCPILGKLSDRFGRKIILLFSLFTLIPSYALTAFSITIKDLSLLFISRFLCGIFEGNLVIAQAVISDLSTSHTEKTKHFGYLVSFASIGFIIGPLLGGRLSDPTTVSWFDNSTPFWAAVLLTTFTFLLIVFLFSETKRKDREIRFHIRELLKSYYRGFSYKNLRSIYIANFLIYLSIFFFFGFFPVFLVDHFHFSAKTLGYVESYLSFPIFLSPFFFGRISFFYSPRKVIKYTGALLCIFLLIFLLPSSSYALIITLLPLGFLSATTFTFTALMISDRANKQIQGEALGLNQSVMVFAEAATGMAGGVFAGIFSALPLMIGAFFALLCSLFLILLDKKNSLHA